MWGTEPNRRISEHTSDHIKSTKFGIPWKISGTESLPNRSDAVKKEKSYKQRGKYYEKQYL